MHCKSSSNFFSINGSGFACNIFENLTMSLVLNNWAQVTLKRHTSLVKKNKTFFIKRDNFQKQYFLPLHMSLFLYGSYSREAVDQTCNELAVWPVIHYTTTAPSLTTKFSPSESNFFPLRVVNLKGEINISRAK